MIITNSIIYWDLKEQIYMIQWQAATYQRIKTLKNNRKTLANHKVYIKLIQIQAS